MIVHADPRGIPLLATSDRIGLGVPHRDILPACERWFNDIETSRTLGVNWHPLTTQMKGRYLDDMLTSDEPAFVIYEISSMEPIGLSGLDHVDEKHGTAEFSIVVGEKAFRGRGLGTEATILTLQYAFDVIGLFNVWLQVSSNNPGAIRAYEKAGFKQIGVRRRSVRAGRVIIDDVYMDAIADDFEPSGLSRLLHPPKEAH
jgi:diamine N-acetyltransferase